jgi:gas vesicle protein
LIPLPIARSPDLRASHGYAILRFVSSRRRIASLPVGAFLYNLSEGGIMQRPNADRLFFAGLVFGAVVGGVATALLAPRSGPETREQIAERGLELKNRAEDVVERAQQVASETVARVQTAAQEMIGQSSSAAALGQATK